MSNNLQPVSKFAVSREFTEAQVRWWIHMAKENGLQKQGALVRIGRRVYIDPQAFDRWIESLRTAQIAA